MAYTKQTWQDLPSKTTPINASRLGHIEQGIYDAASTADTAASDASSAISGLADKVDKVEGKGLSTNDFTDTLKTKLDNVEAGAEVNVQSDWDEDDSSSDAFIQNKPTLGTSAYKNSTSVVTQSTDLVESGAVYDVVKGSVGFVTTGKNLLNNTATNKSTSDLSFTVNADKSVTINGTATANRILALNDNFDSTALAGCLANGLSNISGLSYRVTSNDYATTYQTIDEDDTAIIDNGSGLSFYIRVANGTVCDNVTIYPMIRRADIIDSTYEPYHASVEESLTEKCNNSVIGTVEGANASKAWSVGEHFINDGAFKEVTQAIASGGAINSSNTVDKPIADCLVHKAGDSVVVAPNTTQIPLSGFLTAGSKSIYMFIPLNKRPIGVTGLTFSASSKIYVRGISGYILNGSLMNTFTKYIDAVTENGIVVRVEKTDGTAFDGTNNTAINVALSECTVTLS